MRIHGQWDVTKRFGVRRFLSVSALAWGFFLCLSVSVVSAQPSEKNVLVLFSSIQPDHKPLDLIETAVRGRVPGQVNFYTAFLDHQRFEDRSYRERMAETIRGEYKQTKLDVVIAAGMEALQLATQYREELFRGVPIVFFGLSKSELKEIKPMPGNDRRDSFSWSAGDDRSGASPRS